MSSVNYGGNTVTDINSSNPLLIEHSWSSGYYGYGNSLNINFEGMVPNFPNGIGYTFYNKQTGSMIYLYGGGFWNNRLTIDSYYMRDLWSSLGSPTDVREIEIRLYERDQYSSSYGQNVPIEDCFFVGSIWLNFQPE
jgi:hypothetical protein